MEAERRDRDAFDGGVDVGVGRDDDRILAAHLRDDALDPLLARLRLGGELVDAQTDLLRTGERNEANHAVRDDDDRRSRCPIPERS